MRNSNRPVRGKVRSIRFIVILLLLGMAGASGCAPVASTVVESPHTAATTAEPEENLLPVRYDAESGKVILTIPDLGKEMLYLNTLATGLGTTPTGLDRGNIGTEAVIRFERHGDRVFLIRVNTDHRAVGGDEALRRSVEESFPPSVLASFSIEREGPAGVQIDATRFFLSDVYDAAGAIRRMGIGQVRLDADRSYIDGARTRAFPLNTEVRSVLTYVSDDPSPTLRRYAADGRSMALQQHHSFVELPDPPHAPRAFDPRAGLFTVQYFDFAQPFDSEYRQRTIVRWRLEPSDTSAYLRGELVEPVKPIVYYLDPAIPEPYRSAFIEGGLWWNDVFEAAGWRNAFRIEMLPDDVDAMDARYPVIYWVHRQERGPSVGPLFRDPRTGEIISTVVRMDSYRSLVNHDIYMGLVPAAPPGGLQIDAEEFAMARRRQHTAHEIGHTLGLAHNFMAATQGRASVMDYPYPLITLDENGELDISRAYRPSAGAHDSLAIRYAYTWFPTPEAEAAGLTEIVREAEAHGLRFITGGHAALSGSYPAATQWIEGEDMLSALERTTAVRRVLMDRFDERAAQTGEPLAVLNRRFAHVYLHHRYALHGATKYIGGMEFGYALAGEATETTRIIPADRQRAALRMVLAALDPAGLRVPERIAELIPPVPFGYGGDLTLISSPAGTAFDPTYTAHSLAQEIVGGLLHPERAARLVAFHSQNPENPSLGEVITALIETTWNGAAASNPQPADEPELRRSTQRAVVDGLLDLAGSSDATAEVRAIAEHHLMQLRDRVDTDTVTAVDHAHRQTIVRDIDRYFDGRDEPARRPRPQPIPLPWP